MTQFEQRVTELRAELGKLESQVIDVQNQLDRLGHAPGLDDLLARIQGFDGFKNLARDAAKFKKIIESIDPSALDRTIDQLSRFSGVMADVASSANVDSITDSLRAQQESITNLAEAQKTLSGMSTSFRESLGTISDLMNRHERAFMNMSDSVVRINDSISSIRQQIGDLSGSSVSLDGLSRSLNKFKPDSYRKSVSEISALGDSLDRLDSISLRNITNEINQLDTAITSLNGKRLELNISNLDNDLNKLREANDYISAMNNYDMRKAENRARVLRRRTASAESEELSALRSSGSPSPSGEAGQRVRDTLNNKWLNRGLRYYGKTELPGHDVARHSANAMKYGRMIDNRTGWISGAADKAAGQLDRPRMERPVLEEEKPKSILQKLLGGFRQDTSGLEREIYHLSESIDNLASRLDRLEDNKRMGGAAVPGTGRGLPSDEEERPRLPPIRPPNRSAEDVGSTGESVGISLQRAETAVAKTLEENLNTLLQNVFKGKLPPSVIEGIKQNVMDKARQEGAAAIDDILPSAIKDVAGEGGLKMVQHVLGTDRPSDLLTKQGYDAAANNAAKVASQAAIQQGKAFLDRKVNEALGESGSGRTTGQNAAEIAQRGIDNLIQRARNELSIGGVSVAQRTKDSSETEQLSALRGSINVSALGRQLGAENALMSGMRDFSKDIATRSRNELLPLRNEVDRFTDQSLDRLDRQIATTIFRLRESSKTVDRLITSESIPDLQERAKGEAKRVAMDIAQREATKRYAIREEDTDRKRTAYDVMLHRLSTGESGVTGDEKKEMAARYNQQIAEAGGLRAFVREEYISQDGVKSETTGAGTSVGREDRSVEKYASQLHMLQEATRQSPTGIIIGTSSLGLPVGASLLGHEGKVADDHAWSMRRTVDEETGEERFEVRDINHAGGSAMGTTQTTVQTPEGLAMAGRLATVPFVPDDPTKADEFWDQMQNMRDENVPYSFVKDARMAERVGGMVGETCASYIITATQRAGIQEMASPKPELHERSPFNITKPMDVLDRAERMSLQNMGQDLPERLQRPERTTLKGAAAATYQRAYSAAIPESVRSRISEEQAKQEEQKRVKAAEELERRRAEGIKPSAKDVGLYNTAHGVESMSLEEKLRLAEEYNRRIEEAGGLEHFVDPSYTAVQTPTRVESTSNITPDKSIEEYASKLHMLQEAARNSPTGIIVGTTSLTDSGGASSLGHDGKVGEDHVYTIRHIVDDETGEERFEVRDVNPSGSYFGSESAIKTKEEIGLAGRVTAVPFDPGDEQKAEEFWKRMGELAGEGTYSFLKNSNVAAVLGGQVGETCATAIVSAAEDSGIAEMANQKRLLHGQPLVHVVKPSDVTNRVEAMSRKSMQERGEVPTDVAKQAEEGAAKGTIATLRQQASDAVGRWGQKTAALQATRILEKRQAAGKKETSLDFILNKIATGGTELNPEEKIALAQEYTQQIAEAGGLAQVAQQERIKYTETRAETESSLEGVRSIEEFATNLHMLQEMVRQSPTGMIVGTSALGGSAGASMLGHDGDAGEDHVFTMRRTVDEQGVERFEVRDMNPSESLTGSKNVYQTPEQLSMSGRLSAVPFVPDTPEQAEAYWEELGKISANSFYSFLKDERVAEQLGGQVGETCATLISHAGANAGIAELQSTKRFIHGQPLLNSEKPADIRDRVERMARKNMGLETEQEARTASTEDPTVANPRPVRSGIMGFVDKIRNTVTNTVELIGDQLKVVPIVIINALKPKTIVASAQKLAHDIETAVKDIETALDKALQNQLNGIGQRLADKYMHDLSHMGASVPMAQTSIAGLAPGTPIPILNSISQNTKATAEATQQEVALSHKTNSHLEQAADSGAEALSAMRTGNRGFDSFMDKAASFNYVSSNAQALLDAASTGYVGMSTIRGGSGKAMSRKERPTISERLGSSVDVGAAALKGMRAVGNIDRTLGLGITPRLFQEFTKGTRAAMLTDLIRAVSQHQYDIAGHADHQAMGEKLAKIVKRRSGTAKDIREEIELILSEHGHYDADRYGRSDAQRKPKDPSKPDKATDTFNTGPRVDGSGSTRSTRTADQRRKAALAAGGVVDNDQKTQDLARLQQEAREQFRKEFMDELQGIDGIGDKTAQQIVDSVMGGNSFADTLSKLSGSVQSRLGQKLGEVQQIVDRRMSQSPDAPDALRSPKEIAEGVRENVRTGANKLVDRAIEQTLGKVATKVATNMVNNFVEKNVNPSIANYNQQSMAAGIGQRAYGPKDIETLDALRSPTDVATDAISRLATKVVTDMAQSFVDQAINPALATVGGSVTVGVPTPEQQPESSAGKKIIPLGELAKEQAAQTYTLQAQSASQNVPNVYVMPPSWGPPADEPPPPPAPTPEPEQRSSFALTEQQLKGIERKLTSAYRGSDRSEVDRLDTQAAQMALRDLFKGTGLEAMADTQFQIVSQEGFEAVLNEYRDSRVRSAGVESLRQGKGLAESKAAMEAVYDEVNQMLHENRTAIAMNVPLAGASVPMLNKDAEEAGYFDRSEVVLHEVAHDMDNRFRRKFGQGITSNFGQDLTRRSETMDFDAVLHQMAEHNKGFAQLVAQNKEYMFSERESLAFMVQAMTGSESTQQSMKALYGEDLYTRMETQIRSLAPDFFADEERLQKFRHRIDSGETDVFIPESHTAPTPTHVYKSPVQEEQKSMQQRLLDGLASVVANADNAFAQLTQAGEAFAESAEMVQSAFPGVVRAMGPGGRVGYGLEFVATQLGDVAAALRQYGERRDEESLQLVKDRAIGIVNPTIGKMLGQQHSEYGETLPEPGFLMRQVSALIPKAIEHAPYEQIGAALAPQELGNQFENEMRDMLRQTTGENMVGVQISEMHDIQEGLDKISISAVDARGKMYQLNGELNRWGEFEMDEPEKNISRFKMMLREVPGQLAEGLFEPLQEFGQLVLEQIGLLIRMQGAMSAVANMGTRMSGGLADTEKIRSDYSRGVLEVAGDTNQLFEEVAPAASKNYRRLAGITDTDKRNELALRLTKMQGSLANLTGLEMMDFDDPMSEIYHNIVGSVSKNQPDLTPAQRTETAVNELERVMSMMVEAETQTGVPIDEMITAFSKVSPGATSVGLSTEDTIAMIADRVVSTGESPEDAAAILEKFIQSYDGLLSNTEKLRDLDALGLQALAAPGELVDIEDFFGTIAEAIEQADTEEAKKALMDRVAAIFSDKPEDVATFKDYFKSFRILLNQDVGSLSSDLANVDQSLMEDTNDTSGVNLLNTINELKAGFLQFTDTLLFSSGILDPVYTIVNNLAGGFGNLSDKIMEMRDTSFLGGLFGEGVTELDALTEGIGYFAKYFVFVMSRSINAFDPLAAAINKGNIAFRALVNSFLDMNMAANTSGTKLQQMGRLAFDSMDNLPTLTKEFQDSGNTAFNSVAGSVQELVGSVQLLVSELKEVQQELIKVDKVADSTYYSLDQMQPVSAMRSAGSSRTQAVDPNETPEQRDRRFNEQLHRDVAIRERLDREEREEKDRIRKERIWNEHQRGMEIGGRVYQKKYGAAQNADELIKMQSIEQRNAQQRMQSSADLARPTQGFRDSYYGTRLERLARGFLDTESRPGRSPFLTQGMQRAGSAAGDMVLPVAFDLMMAENQDDITNTLGAGIAGGFITFATGNPMLGAIGYEISKSFLEHIDFAGIMGTSDQETNALKNALAQARAEEENPEIARQREEERIGRDRQMQEDKNLLNKTYGLYEAQEFLQANFGSGGVNIGSLQEVLKEERLSGTEFKTFGEARNARIERTGEYGDQDFEAAASALVKMRDQLGEEDLDKFLSLVETQGLENLELRDLIHGLGALAGTGDIEDITEGILKDFDMSQVAEAGAGDIDLDVSGVQASSEDLELSMRDFAEAISQIEEDMQMNMRERASDYGVSRGMVEFGPGGKALRELDEKFAPELDKIYSGQYDGTEEGEKKKEEILSKYERSKESIRGMADSLSTVIPLADELDQNIEGIETVLYSMGAEGQAAFMEQVSAIKAAQDQIFEFEQLQVALRETKLQLQDAEKANDVEAIKLAEQKLEQLQKEINLRKEGVGAAQEYLDSQVTGEGSLMEMAQQQASKSKRRRWVPGTPGTPGTPAEFRAPSIMDVDDYSNDQLREAIDAARRKQDELVKIMPEMAEEFRKAQFLMEGGGGYAQVTGVEQSYVQDALRQIEERAEFNRPDTVDMSDLNQEEYQKVVARARQLQGDAVSLAPGLADEYDNSNLLMMRENNKLLMEHGLSQEWLRVALEENTNATEENSDELRGHYNLPGGYQMPTVWDYYNEGGRETGEVNYPGPPGADSNMVPMEMAEAMAAEMAAAQLAGGTGDDALDLGALGSMVDPNAAQFGYPDPGTAGTPGTAGYWEEMADLENINTDALHVAGSNMLGEAGEQAAAGLDAVGALVGSALGEDVPTAAESSGGALEEQAKTAQDAASATSKLTEDSNMLSAALEATSSVVETAFGATLTTAVDTASASLNAFSDTSTASYEQTTQAVINFTTALDHAIKAIQTFDPAEAFKNIQVINIEATTVNVKGNNNAKADRAPIGNTRGNNQNKVGNRTDPGGAGNVI